MTKKRGITIEEFFDYGNLMVTEPRTPADVPILVESNEWAVEFAPGRRTRITLFRTVLEAALRDAAEDDMNEWRIVYVGSKVTCATVAKMLRKNSVAVSSSGGR
jgi:hypothetical protein